MAKKAQLSSMKKPHPEHPGLERDSKGKPIPVAKRLPEDKAKVHGATAKRSRAKKK